MEDGIPKQHAVRKNSPGKPSNMKNMFARLAQADLRELKIIDIVETHEHVERCASVRDLECRIADTRNLGAAATCDDENHLRTENGSPDRDDLRRQPFWIGASILRKTIYSDSWSGCNP